MTHIICRAGSCLFWEQGICGAEAIEYEPDIGCLTFQDMGDLELEAEEEGDLAWENDSDLFEDNRWDDDEEDGEWEDGDY